MSKSKQKPKTKPSKPKPAAKTPSKPKEAKAPGSKPEGGLKVPKSGTKLDTLIKLMSRPDGADIETLAKAVEQQKHTVRSTISHGLVKLRGYKVEKIKTKGELTVYKIAASPQKADKKG